MFATRTAIAASLVALLVACGGDDGPTGPGVTGACGVTPSGTMTAQVNGAAFTASLQTSAVLQSSGASAPNIAQVTGAECPSPGAITGRSITITVGRLTPITAGTYSLDPASQGLPAGSGYSGIATYTLSPNLWYSNLSDATGPGSGTITFTTVSPTRLAGTFQITAVAPTSNAANARGRTTITSGSFDIPVR